jgi:hypothetical protein
VNPLSSLRELLGLDDADGKGGDGDVRPRALAAELVDAHPGRDLDYTPASLLALDELAVARSAELDAAAAADDPAEVDDPATVDAAAADEPGTVDTDAVEAANEAIRRLGAYLGETFVRAYGGEWTFDESAGWVVELPATHRGEPLVLTIPSVLGDVVDGGSSFAAVHDVFAAELDVDAPNLADAEDAPEPVDPREEPSPAEVVAAFDAAASELAADHDELDFSPDSLGALDAVARADHDRDAAAYDPDTDDLAFEVGGHTDAIAGYFAAVVRTHHTAEYRGELAETLVVDGATRTARLDPRSLAAAVAAGEASFEGVYADVSDDLGLGEAGD